MNDPAPPEPQTVTIAIDPGRSWWETWPAEKVAAHVRMCGTDANQAICRAESLLQEAQRILGQWVEDHGIGCECEFCRYHADRLEHIGREVYTARAMLDCSAMYLVDHTSYTPAETVARIDPHLFDAEQDDSEPTVTPDATIGGPPDEATA